MASPVHMTPDGHKRLVEQIKRMKTTDLQAISKDLEEARSHGDLSENAEYEIAKDNHSKLLKQISDLEAAIANAQIIDPSTLTHDRVVFGSVVEMRDFDNDETIRYQIVGIYESDLKFGKISIESPIARGLIGKFEGDEVKITTPKGIKEFEIISICGE